MFRTYRDVANPGAEDVLAQVGEQHARLVESLAGVQRIIVVGSGKGGVGKSALTANLAAALASQGLRIGAVDADLNGPSLARMLAAHGRSLRVDGDRLEPVRGAAGVSVISMDLLLAEDDSPLRWHGPDAPAFLWQSTLEGGVVREFLADTRWGVLDCLLIDAPPGTDKLVRLLQLLPRIDALLLVTTPSEIARFVVAKSLRLAREAGACEIGLVVNMSAHFCEACGQRTPLFDEELLDSSPASLVPDAGTWAEIPFDRRLAITTDRGEPFVLAAPEAPASRALRALADRLQRVGIEAVTSAATTSHQPAAGEPVNDATRP